MGYETIDGKKFVRQEDALEYALYECGFAIEDEGAPYHEEAKDAFLFWFFSDWVEVDE